MAQIDIKQIRGASQGSILFLGTNSTVSEDFSNLNWSQSDNIFYINGNIQIVDGNQQEGYVLTTDANGLATWTNSKSGTGSTGLGTYWLDESELSFMNIGVSSSGDIRYIDFTEYSEITGNRLFSNGENLIFGLNNNIGVNLGSDTIRSVILNKDINKGSVVSIIGGSGSYNIVDFALADGSMDDFLILGLTLEDGLSDSISYVLSNGKIEIDTTGTPYGETWSSGDIIYLSSTISGGLTNIKPVSPNNVLIIGNVISVGVEGVLDVRVNFDNGLDVAITGTPSLNSIIQYNSTRWENREFPILNDTTIIGGLTFSGYYMDTDSWSASTIITVNGLTNSLIGSGYRFNDSGVGNLDIWSADKVIDFFEQMTVGGGLLSLNGLTQSVQTFTTSNDENISLDITSSSGEHNFQLSWNNTLSLERGGLSNSTFTASQILIVDSSTSSVISSGYQFNDSGTSSNDIWSAEKTLDYYGAPTNYAGIIDEGTGFIDNNDGTITLPTVKVGLFDNPDYKGVVKDFEIDGGTTGTEFTSLPDNSTSYINIEYNSGNPIWSISSTEGNCSDIVTYLRLYRFGTILHILEFGETGSGLSNRLSQRVARVSRYARESGFALSLSSGIVDLTGGVVWNVSYRQSLPSVNSDTGPFFKNYKVSGDWVVDFSATGGRVNNEFYNDGTNRITATAGNFIVNWYYRGQEEEPHLYEVYGSNEYNSVLDAQLETEPGLPELVLSHAFLVGRIIIEVGENEGLIESAFTRRFAATSVPNHNDLSGLQGGEENQFYHLTQYEYDNNVVITGTPSVGDAPIWDGSNWVPGEAGSGGGGGGRTKSTETTTDDTETTIETIDITDNRVSFIEVFITARSSTNTEWGVWKRTLGVTKFSGTTTITQVSSDMDSQSENLSPVSVSFEVSAGNVNVNITGIESTTINWESAHEIITTV